MNDLLKVANIVVDCTPKGFGAENAPRYRESKTKFILQGGEKLSLSTAYDKTSGILIRRFDPLFAYFS